MDRESVDGFRIRSLVKLHGSIHDCLRKLLRPRVELPTSHVSWGSVVVCCILEDLAVWPGLDLSVRETLVGLLDLRLRVLRHSVAVVMCVDDYQPC